MKVKYVIINSIKAWKQREYSLTKRVHCFEINLMS